MKPVNLKQGGLTMEFEAGGLRYISYNGIELARGIYAAVRDRNWGTVEPNIRDMELNQTEDTTNVTFTCEHKRDEIDFTWQGRINMTATQIQFEFDGLSHTAFLRNRIGFCVLHPMEFAALPLEVITANETIAGKFPLPISAHQPFKNINQLKYKPAPHVQVEMSFAGDLFEMEDQRNWTDASFKTYCTPLELPFPVEVKPGDKIYQKITVSLQELITESAKQLIEADGDDISLTVTSHVIRKLPDIGVLIDAAAMEKDSAAVNSHELATAIKQLKPAYVKGEIDCSVPDWPSQLHYLQQCIERLKNSCEIELNLFYTRREQLEELAAYIADNALNVKRVIPFRDSELVCSNASIEEVRGVFRTAQLLDSIAVGGGTRANYAEHNRASLPLNAMDFTSYTINPQVHAFDDRSLVETVFAHAVTAKDATSKSGKPLYLGPITLLPRMNPNATSGDYSITVDQQIDARQFTSFGAAWTIGSLAALCQEDLPLLRGICYYNLLGPAGIASHPNSPLYKVLQPLMSFQAADVLTTLGTSQRIAALSLRDKDGRFLIAAANLTAEDITIHVKSEDRKQEPVTKMLAAYACSVFHL